MISHQPFHLAIPPKSPQDPEVNIPPNLSPLSIPDIPSTPALSKSSVGHPKLGLLNSDLDEPSLLIQNVHSAGGENQVPLVRYFQKRHKHVEKKSPLTCQPQASTSDSGTDITLADLDVPIALRKGSRSCTTHPI